MKRLLWLAVVVTVLALVLGCSLDKPWDYVGENPPEALPPDVVADTLRTYGGQFTYETLLPVALKLAVNLYAPESGQAATLIPTDGPKRPPVFVTLKDSKGNVVYQSRVGDDGRLETQLKLPAAREAMTLILEAEGYKKREFTIEGMVDYAEVDRTVGLMAAAATPGSSALSDRDGDLIPDVYDAFPDDPELAFSYTPDPDGLTVAFEDLFNPLLPTTGAGDADYNDFVAHYTLTKDLDPKGSLYRLRGEAVAVDKIAGYNHDFGIFLRFHFSDMLPKPGEASVTLQYFDENGEYLSAESFKWPRAGLDSDQGANIKLFSSTKDSVGHRTEFTVYFSPALTEDQFDYSPYDPYLYVRNTGFDIHLIGEQPLPNSNNPPDSSPPEDTFRDEAGFPWALLVPADWVPPPECTRIETVYPLFDSWRASRGVEDSNWYLFPAGTTPPTNAPPVASFPTWDYEVQGAGTAAVNGAYAENGTAPSIGGPVPKYDQVSGSYSLYAFYENSGYNRWWAIHNVLDDTADPTTRTYYNPSTASTPPASGWQVGSGGTPAPALLRMPISGDLSTVGAVLTGHYLYSDPDNNPEGASTYQWFRGANAADPGTAIPGGTGLSYTTVATDLGTFLRFQVTPVDSLGLAGSAITSSAVRIGGGS